MAAILRDFRYSLRSLRRSPVFLSVAVLSLALGIGANTAIFTLIHQLILQPLPVRDPEQLVMLAGRGNHYGGNNGPDRLSYPMYQEIRDKNQVFSGMFCTYPGTVSASYQGGTELIGADFVSGNYFPVLGIGAAVGRVFTASDDLIQGGHPVAVLSHGYWRSRFGADPGVLGKEIVVNGRALTIIGVSQAGFDGVEPGRAPQIRIPMTMRDELPHTEFSRLNTNRFRWAEVFGRLKPGMTVQKAQAGLQPLFHQILNREVTEKPFAKASPFVKQQFLKMWMEVMPGLEGPLQPAQNLLEAPVCADGDRRPRASHRLLESGEPADCARIGAAEGDCRAARLGRGARGPRPPTPDGKPAHRHRRRDPGRRSRRADRSRADWFSAFRPHSALPFQHAGLDGSRFHLRASRWWRARSSASCRRCNPPARDWQLL